MKNKLIIYLIFIGLISFLSRCKKDETKVVMSANPTIPTIVTLPDLTLLRANATDTLVFVGTPIDPGFQTSATYFLEACATGNNFKDSVVILTGVHDAIMKITVSDINGVFLKKFPADQVSTVDFRIRAVLTIDAGTGYKPMIYSSDLKTADVTIYGLPRLDLIGSGITQKIESAFGDGKYTGYVKLNVSNPFTLKDPDANIVYGASGAALAVDGTSIAIPAAGNGWYKLSVDTKALTYTIDPFMIGLVGSATVNGWNSPDTKMDYNAQKGTWYITTNLIDGQIKFRLNDGWAWNLGWNPAKNGLTHNGDNIDVAAGNYTINLTITSVTPPEAGTFTIVKN